MLGLVVVQLVVHKKVGGHPLLDGAAAVRVGARDLAELRSGDFRSSSFGSGSFGDGGFGNGSFEGGSFGDSSFGGGGVRSGARATCAAPDEAREAAMMRAATFSNTSVGRSR